MEHVLVEVDVVAAAETMRASLLIGADVANEEGAHIGAIDDLMIAVEMVEFAILAVGSFLGLASHLVVVPFSDLQIDGAKITLPGVTRDQLKNLPEFHYR